MAYTNAEIQARYKARMYGAGYHQTMIWTRGVKKRKMDGKTFVKKLGKLTSGWDEASLSALYGLLLEITEGRKEAAGRKGKG